MTPTPTPTPECWKSWSDWTDEEWVQADRGGEPRKRAFPLLNDDDLPFTIHGVRPGLTSRQAVAVWGEGSLSMGGWGCQRSVESRPLLIVHAVVPSDPVVAVWGDQLEHHGQLLAWEGLSASELHGLLGAPARSGPHVTCGGRGNEEEWSYDLWHVVIDVLLVDGVVRSFTIRYRGVDYTGC